MPYIGARRRRRVPPGRGRPWQIRPPTRVSFGWPVAIQAGPAMVLSEGDSMVRSPSAASVVPAALFWPKLT